MPIGTPIETEITKAIAASCMVTGSFVATSCSTGWRMRHENPRSPCNTLPIQWKYWITNGRSSHNSWRIWASTAGSRSSPASTSAGSPGISCCRQNTMTLTRKMVGMICAMRSPRWDFIAPAYWPIFRPLIRISPSAIGVNPVIFAFIPIRTFGL